MLKTIFNWLLLLALLSSPAWAQERAPQRVAALVDYVAADYAGAVRDGQVISAAEYAEQRNLLGEAQKLVAGLAAGSAADRAALEEQLQALLRAVDERAPLEQVQERCRAVRAALRDRFHLHLVPTGPVSFERAAQLFQKNCASCHGPTGRADGPQARALNPPPVSFHDAEKMARIAPSLAFHALTFGIPGTAMPPFDMLSAGERWDLAFYVVSLRHRDLEQHKGQAAPPLSLLAEKSDAELLQQLPHLGGPELAYLRVRYPAYGEGAATQRYRQAKDLVGQALQAAERGDRKRAHDLSLSAYLDGFEPQEAALKARDRDLVAHLERAFMDLRMATEHPDINAVRSSALAVLALLEKAEQNSGQGQSSWAFSAALVIALREGLEAALLIAALLAFLRKSGRAHQACLVHLGWGLAVPAGILTFLVAGALVSGQRRELAEAITTFLAAAILLTVTHWVLGAHEAKSWLGFLRRRVDSLGQGSAGAHDHATALLGLSFFAAYREAFEIVLFYRALLLEVGAERWRPVALGALLGAGLMVAVVLLVGRIGRRLNPRPVMLASSVLLALLSLSLAGQGVRSLQEGGYLGISPVVLFDHEISGLPSLGFHATWQGLTVQALVLVLLLLPSLIVRLRHRHGRGVTAQKPALLA